jgi:nicotinamidase-related amidase
MATGNSVVAETDYAAIVRRPLEAARCALVVVDIQEKLVRHIYEKERLLRNAQLLARAVKLLEVPALTTTQNARGLGPVVPELAELLPNQNFMDKTSFDSFAYEPFAAAVKALPGKRNTLLVCGMETHSCVLQTVLTALEKGYLVHVPVDAVGSRTELNWKVGLERMRAAGAVLSSTETIIFELVRGFKTPAFKELLPYLK